MLVNAVIHIGAAARFRCYNPGLVTSVLVFLPLSIWTLLVIGDVDVAFHWVGLGLAILIHVLIVIAIVNRYRRIKAR